MDSTEGDPCARAGILPGPAMGPHRYAAGTCASYERSGGGQQVPPLQLHKPHDVFIVKRPPRLLLMPLLWLGWVLCSRV